MNKKIKLLPCQGEKITKKEKYILEKIILKEMARLTQPEESKNENPFRAQDFHFTLNVFNNNYWDYDNIDYLIEIIYPFLLKFNELILF